MLVIPPLGKAGQPVKHPLVVGVEDMRSVLVNQHAGLVRTVIGVPACMGPAFQHQHPLPALGQRPGGHSAGIARAGNQGVILMRQDEFILSRAF